MSGWRRAALAAGLGFAAAGAMPPLFIVVLLVPAFTGLMWLVDSSRNARAAALAGWWFGLGHFAAGLYWIASALLVDAATFGWLIPFAILGISAVLAAFFAIATGLCRYLGGRGPGRALVLAALWAALEWVRSWAFTGFPWNLTATVWTGWDGAFQAVAYIGPYGLGLLTVWVAAAPAYVGMARHGGRTLAVAAAILAGAVGGGVLSLPAVAPPPSDAVRLRLVQPDIRQQLKWVDSLRASHVVKQIEMSRLPAADPPPQVVIWAETAVPYFLAAEPGLLQDVATAVPPGGLLITGAPRAERGADGKLVVWNSLHAIDDAARIRATYDKFHLVPFGEYVPFRDLVGGIKLTQGRVDFSPGPGPRTLHLPGLPPFSPLICYEIIFPAAVAADDDRPAWILNLTNDGWFGMTAGPYQHLAAARLRATEQGLPVVRVANTGISAVIDARGRVLARLGLGQAGVLDATLPPSLAGPTLFARGGNAVTLVVVLAGLLAGVALTRRRGAGH